jgi:hypothetical protein
MRKNHLPVLLSCIGIGAIALLGLTSAEQPLGSPSSDSRADQSKSAQQQQGTIQEKRTMTRSQSSSVSPKQLSQIEQKLNIPNGFVLVTSQSVAMNGKSVWHLRYERADQRNRGLHGEHFSAVLSQNGERLEGFTRMEKKLSTGQLLDEGQAKTAAIAYLQKNAPDLLNSMEIQWIKPHDEQIQIQRETGKPQTVGITGMKVKCYNAADGRYFWVIVGSQNQIITFERDIVWSNNMGKRETEKWLHDTWVAEQR